MIIHSLQQALSITDLPPLTYDQLGTQAWIVKELLGQKVWDGFYSDLCDRELEGSSIVPAKLLEAVATAIQCVAAAHGKNFAGSVGTRQAASERVAATRKAHQDLNDQNAKRHCGGRGDAAGKDGQVA